MLTACEELGIGFVPYSPLGKGFLTANCWLEENIGAADLQLSADEIAEIEGAASKIEVQAGRCHEAQERMTNL